MSLRLPGWAICVATPILWASLPFLAGCPGDFQGPAGEPGPPGPEGMTGLSSGDDLPGLVLGITEVSGASGAGGAFQPGDTMSVTFTVQRGDGSDELLEELDFFQIFLSGPTTSYQRVIPPQSDVIEQAVANADGSYTYTFPDPLPDVYEAPPNDSDAFGSDAGEMTGEPLASGTYTVGMNAYKGFMIDGETFRDAANATFDFLLGDATELAPREVVLRANCNDCHVDLRLHGGIRKETTLCVLCHVAGAEDLISDDPAKATPGVTIEFRRMIHRIHKGVELRRVGATANSADPYRYQIIGFRESVHDFSDIEFPRLPGGTGFNEQTRNCGACHDGAAQGSAYFERPTRAVCGSCHDDVNFADGTKLDPDDPDVADGLLTAAELDDPAHRIPILGMPGLANDDLCTLCHAPGSSLGADVVHRPTLLNEDLTRGLTITIESVGGGSGPAGVLRPGDAPVVTFNITDRDGVPVDVADLTSINAVMAGPTGNYQHIIPADSTTLSVIGDGGVPASGTGPFTYTFAEPIPGTYPPPLNDSPDFDFAGGWGELQGQPLQNGTYTIAMYAYETIEVAGTSFRDTTLAAIANVRIGRGTITPHAPIVTNDTCNSCHGDLRFHGNTRRNVQLCVLCHTSGAEDNVPTEPEAPEPDTIDFKVMIHKIHKGRELHVVEDGGRYDLGGFGGRLIDFSTGLLPAMPGGARHCDKCHGDSDAWKSPTERDDLRIWMKVCTSCHDSADEAAHVNAQTFSGVESCVVCHGEGAAFAVEVVHKNR